MIDIFKKREKKDKVVIGYTPSPRPEKTLIERYEELVEEQMLLRQYLSEQVTGFDCISCDVYPSDELQNRFHKVFRGGRRSKMVWVWGIIEKYTEELKKKNQDKK
jgi:hypothetical protein